MVLSCPEISEITKEELEKTVVALKVLKHWKIEKITLLEDHRSTA